MYARVVSQLAHDVSQIDGLSRDFLHLGNFSYILPVRFGHISEVAEFCIQMVADVR